MTAVSCIGCGTPLAVLATGAIAPCPNCDEKVRRNQLRQSTGTQPNTLLAIGLATALAVAFYALGPFFLLRDTGLYHLFCGHGWVPYACVYLFCCALCILLLKLPLIWREESAFGIGLLPEEPEATIGPADSEQILNRIGRLEDNRRSLLLVVRIRQAILRLHQLGTSEKLDDLLRYRADNDAAAMDSSYSAPKFIIWAIPVLGFVGTVIGISNGVQAFSTLIQNAADLDGLRESLKGVTYGLGQAFETTMLALCMSLILMLIMSVLQRREDGLLARLDTYCMENLLQRVQLSEGAAHPTRTDIAAMTDAIKGLTEQWRESQRSQELAQKESRIKG